MAILGIGFGLVIGSAIKMLRPSSVRDFELKNVFNKGVDSSDSLISRIRKSSNKNQSYKLELGSFNPKTEVIELSSRWASIAKQHPDLIVSAYMLILDDGRYAKYNPDIELPAASSIKTAVLIALLQQVETGKIRWNELLELKEDVIAGGAGWMALKPIGTVFPVHDTATEMIRVSDNTATNLLIKRIGGLDFLNANFKALGLKSTIINNFLPDLSGTNITSARDLAMAIALVDTGKVLGTRARDLFREVMSTSVSNRLIPAGLLKGLGVNEEDPDKTLLIKGYRVYNKTGDIGIAYADAGLIELPDGRRAVAGFLVKGPFNDPRSREMIRDLVASMIPTLVRL
ncbi:serine hydrolase [Prochlorococcus sp. MIT 1341]|uniref:serine hydrolase n=1 Tax=Prochlorococcus sp. MIT 1341 TaxID=3096221 RepID=UPI002A75BAEE|nr:serine hydrolase [Prochlorococcus sp. MIT 1341]